MIPGIVLAAGASSRMGRPKALLRAGDRSFLEQIVRTLQSAGSGPIVVVVRPEALDVAAEALRAGAEPVVNTRPQEGQLTSLIAGMDAVETASVPAVLVTLVDIPLIRVETVAAMLARLQRSRAAILRPAYRRKHGHPVIFTRQTFAALRSADPAIGAKPVMRRFSIDEVEVDDAGVVEDVDTPEDYQRLFC